MKIHRPLTLADSICDLRARKIKQTFLAQMNRLIDWEKVSSVIDIHYVKGSSASGTPGYDGLLLFKMGLLQTWYGLSDYEVEDRVNDSISFGYFCGLTIEQAAPDHSTVSRFRTAMTAAGAYEPLFHAINGQLENHGIIVKKGLLVDASVIDTPLRPKGKAKHAVADDREDGEEGNEEASLTREYPTSVDTDATWLKKRGRYHFGYKKHHVTDMEGLVLGVLTTTASVNEVSNLGDVLDTVQLPEGIALKADKGYRSKKNADLMKKRKIRDHIMKKAARGRPLTEREKQFNRLVSKVRYKVERTFGGIKRWFSGGVARYRGLPKMHTQNLMEALCYNLYRSPNLFMSNQLAEMQKQPVS